MSRRKSFGWCLGAIRAILSTTAIFHAVAASGADARAVLMVNIRPEVAISLATPESVGIRIRLAAQSQARVWKANLCDSPPTSGYKIVESGTYLVAVSALEGEGISVCLDSSDGSLRALVSLGSKR